MREKEDKEQKKECLHDGYAFWLRSRGHEQNPATKSRRGRVIMALITKEQRCAKIKARLENHLDELSQKLADGEKITLVPSRTCFKAFAGFEYRLDLDNKSMVGGAVDE